MRPNTITDTWGFWLLDPSTGTVVGRRGVLDRGRVMSATRLGEYSNSQWHYLKPPVTIVDTWGFNLMDPATKTVVGKPGISVQRCLTARWVEGGRVPARAPLPPPPPIVGEDVPTNIVVFNADGVYLPPVNLVSVIVECIGGGGAGANAVIDPINWGPGSGGGSGSYARSVLSAAEIGAAQTVTIGDGGESTPLASFAGGTTSFGALVSAPGGSPGYQLLPGLGGPRGTGQFTMPGASGVASYYAPTQFDSSGFATRYSVVSGDGGSFWGGNGISVHEDSSSVSDPGVNAVPNSGAGGSGALTVIVGGALSDVPGGTGGSGVCIITEYTYPPAAMRR